MDIHLDGSAAVAFVQGAEAARLTGSALHAVDAGTLALPSGAVDDLAERHRRALLWCLHLEGRLLQVRDWFTAAGGVRHLVIKGPAIAHLDEPDPERRTFADLDLLVEADHLGRAVEVLAAQGARRPWSERRRGFDRRFAKSVTMTMADGVELDLHRTLTDGVHGVRVPLADLFAAPDRFDLGGEEFATLRPEHRLLHAAFHAVLGSPAPRLMSLRDLARYLVREDLGPDRILPEVARWRGEMVLALGIDLATEVLTFDAPPWTEWRDQFREDAHERRMIDRHRREGSSLGRAKLDVLRELPTGRDRAAYALALAVPSRQHLRSRGLRRRDLLGR